MTPWERGHPTRWRPALKGRAKIVAMLRIDWLLRLCTKNGFFASDLSCERR